MPIPIIEANEKCVQEGLKNCQACLPEQRDACLAKFSQLSQTKPADDATLYRIIKDQDELFKCTQDNQS